VIPLIFIFWRPNETCPEYSGGALASLRITIRDISHSLTRRPVLSFGYGDCGWATPNWDHTALLLAGALFFVAFANGFTGGRDDISSGSRSNGALGDVNWPVEIFIPSSELALGQLAEYIEHTAHKFDYGLRSGNWPVRIILSGRCSFFRR